jgi:hypothetical protein
MNPATLTLRLLANAETNLLELAGPGVVLDLRHASNKATRRETASAGLRLQGA